MLNGRSRLHSSLFALAMVALAFSLPAAAQDNVIGYYPTWLNGTIRAGQVRWSVITHVNHAFAWPRADASITSDQIPVDTAIINTAHRAGRKILISLGGASESGAFAGIAADSTLRATFSQNLLTYVTAHHYDGADLDWESPASLGDKSNEVALVRTIRNAFNTVNTPLLLTMAVGPTGYSGQWHDFSSLRQYVDWFNVMTYDFHGSWSGHSGHNAPLYAPASDNDGSVDQGVFYLQRSRGIPASQLMLGLPFYGQKFNSSSLYGPSTGGTSVLYSEIVPLMSQGWRTVWDSVSRVPYLIGPSNNGIVSYDDSLSLTLKCAYAKSHGLGGVMIWALGEDMIAGKQPLMDAVELAMTGSTGVAERQSDFVPITAELFQNYPNPFNASTIIRYATAGNRDQGTGNSNVRLAVYNVLGQEVVILVNENQNPGVHEVRFDGTNLSSGIYFCRIATGSYAATKAMILMK